MGAGLDSASPARLRISERASRRPPPLRGMPGDEDSSWSVTWSGDPLSPSPRGRVGCTYAKFAVDAVVYANRVQRDALIRPGAEAEVQLLAVVLE